MKPRVIVTGAGGFIGANLVRKLIDLRYPVHVLVRKNTNYWRLDELIKRLVYHQDALEKPVRLKRLVKKINPQIIFHLVTYGSYPRQENHQMLINSNITCTLNLLEAIREINYQQFVSAGSSSEYGKKDQRMNERDVLEPNNYYAAAKASQAYFIKAYGLRENKPAIILRLFNVYGPYEEKGRLVRNVIEAGLSGHSIKLATGKEARDFVYTEDVSDAFIKASKHSEFKGDIFNIGTGKQTTIYELSKTVLKILNKKVPIRLNAYQGRPWDTFYWKADTRKTKKLLDWEPEHTLAQGLRETITWYQKHTQ